MRIIGVRAGEVHYKFVTGYEILGDSGISGIMETADRIGVVISERVRELHGDYITGCIADGGRGTIFPMKDGEEYKNYSHAEEFFKSLLSAGFSRRSLLIGIGGGVVGDFTGYLAAGFMRGISVIHAATTLLAMVDSSIGGKAAVNISAGKNIVGAFHQPSLVVADIRFLDTLPYSELKNGIAETLKHAIIGERRLIDLLLSNTPESIREREVMEELIVLSAGFKAGIVGRDERESGVRAILNFGHTVGHAIESLMNYRGISHGEAVALGMEAELEISIRMGMLSRDDAEIFRELSRRYGLVERKFSLDVDGIIEHMKFDKKSSRGVTRFALLKGIGEPVFDQEVDESIVRESVGLL